MRSVTLPGGRQVPYWALAVVAAVIVAAVTTTAVVARTSLAACAAPAAVEARSGSATFYTGSTGGNCMLGQPADRMFVALGPAEYAAAGACGGYLDVTGPKGTVRVKVTDQCPECAPGHIDLSQEAFARIAAPANGVVPVSYRPVRDPAVPGPLAVRLKVGVSRYWFAVLVDNHGNPLATVEVKAGGGWVKLRREDYNYWLKDDGAGPGPFTLRVTDTTGRQALVPGVVLSPDKLQKTSVSMYGAAAVAPAVTGSRTPSPAAPTASPPVAAAAESPVRGLTPEASPRIPSGQEC